MDTKCVDLVKYQDGHPMYCCRLGVVPFSHHPQAATSLGTGSFVPPNFAAPSLANIASHSGQLLGSHWYSIPFQTGHFLIVAVSCVPIPTKRSLYSCPRARASHSYFYCVGVGVRQSSLISLIFSLIYLLPGAVGLVSLSFWQI
jgi:hypothetical protein